MIFKQKAGIITSFIFAFLMYCSRSSDLWPYKNQHKCLIENDDASSSMCENKRIDLAMILCGEINQVEKIRPFFKSIFLFSSSPIVFHFVVEDLFVFPLQNMYYELPSKIRDRVKFYYYQTWYPNIDFDWSISRNYHKCVFQKLFLTTIIPNVDKLLFIDIDTIVTKSIEKIWQKFSEFGPNEIMGATPDCESEWCAYYKQTKGSMAHVPAVWNSGLNSGVLFMRLDRMREFGFEEKIQNLLLNTTYHSRLAFPEQDLLNILFYKNIKRLKYIDCSFNYFPLNYCNNSNSCNLTDGIKIVHGAGHQFEKPQSLFNQIGRILIEIDLNMGRSKSLANLNENIARVDSRDRCYQIKKLIFND